MKRRIFKKSQGAVADGLLVSGKPAIFLVPADLESDP